MTLRYFSSLSRIRLSLSASSVVLGPEFLTGRSQLPVYCPEFLFGSFPVRNITDRFNCPGDLPVPVIQGTCPGQDIDMLSFGMGKAGFCRNGIAITPDIDIIFHYFLIRFKDEIDEDWPA